MVLRHGRPYIFLPGGRRLHPGQFQPLRPPTVVRPLQVLPYLNSDALDMILSPDSPTDDDMEDERQSRFI